MNIKKWGCYGCEYLSGTYCQFLKEELKEDTYCPEYKFQFRKDKGENQ